MPEAPTLAALPPAPAFDRARVAALLRSDPPAALARVRAAARAGHVSAQSLYAQMLCEGRGTAVDAAEGLYWYTLAASAGDARAMNMVGRCHELGHGTPADVERAAAWYRKAAACGLDWGMYNLANLLATGRGVQADPAGALDWYRSAAALGHAKSMNLVGRHYEEGWLVERDPAAALEWYRRSAFAGDFRGQASYAAVLAESGRIDEAARWLRRTLATGTPAFLARTGHALLASPHPLLQEIGREMLARADRP